MKKTFVTRCGRINKKMRNLINFLLRHSSWIVLAIYVAISCVLLFGRNPYQRSIYLSSANQVASAVYDLQSEVTSYFGLREQEFAITKRGVGDGGNKSERTVESL